MPGIGQPYGRPNIVIASFQIIDSRVIDQVPAVLELRPAAFHAQSRVLMPDVLDDQVVGDLDEFARVIDLVFVRWSVVHPLVFLPAEFAAEHCGTVSVVGQSLEREGYPLHLKRGIFVKTLVELLEGLGTGRPTGLDPASRQNGQKAKAE
jgi:hypothetical protein